MSQSTLFFYLIFGVVLVTVYIFGVYTGKRCERNLFIITYFRIIDHINYLVRTRQYSQLEAFLQKVSSRVPQTVQAENKVDKEK